MENSNEEKESGFIFITRNVTNKEVISVFLFMVFFISIAWFAENGSEIAGIIMVIIMTYTRISNARSARKVAKKSFPGKR